MFIIFIDYKSPIGLWSTWEIKTMCIKCLLATWKTVMIKVNPSATPTHTHHKFECPVSKCRHARASLRFARTCRPINAPIDRCTANTGPGRGNIMTGDLKFQCCECLVSSWRRYSSWIWCSVVGVGKYQYGA